MVNILPKSAQNKLQTLYYLRLLTLIFFSATIVLVGGGALLLPSYFLAQGEAQASQEYNNALEQTVALKDSKTTATNLSILSEQVKLLKSYEALPAIALTLAALTAHVPKGVALSQILLAPPAGTDGKIAVDGIAKSRESLLAFVNSLQGDSLFKNVIVPVSDLAGDTDLPFSLTFYFNPQQK